MCYAEPRSHWCAWWGNRYLNIGWLLEPLPVVFRAWFSFIIPDWCVKFKNCLVVKRGLGSFMGIHPPESHKSLLLILQHLWSFLYFGFVLQNLFVPSFSALLLFLNYIFLWLMLHREQLLPTVVTLTTHLGCHECILLLSDSLVTVFLAHARFLPFLPSCLCLLPPEVEARETWGW